MTKQTFGFSESEFSFGASVNSEQIFPEHKNQAYFDEDNETSVQEKMEKSKAQEKKEANLSIGSWALARGRRY